MIHVKNTILRNSLHKTGHPEGGAKNARNCWYLKWTAIIDDIGRRLDIGDHALITGWGRITNDLLIANEQFLKENVATRILRKVKVPILSNEVCSKFQLESDSQICAGGVDG